jgi:acyl-CoA reductase-like NAD-dependent aldehyde dehydrogenase
MLLKDKLFIGGRWVAPAGGETIEVHNAGNGEVMGRVPAGNEKDADAAVKAARSAFEGWKETPVEKRA